MSNEEKPRDPLKEGEVILPQDQIDTMLGIDAALQAEAAAKPQTESTFRPKVPIKKETVEAIKSDQIQTADADFNVKQRIADLEAALKKLKEGENGVRVTQASSKPITDFSKLKESDVYDLSLNIEAIVHDLPDSALINLKDPNYIGRWVNVNPMNMGKRKAQGFTYVTKEDMMDGKLQMDLDEDENGVFRYNDVVAMKIPKQKYFQALRANHLRALAIVSKNKAHEVGKTVAQNEMQRGRDPEGHSYSRDYQKYTSEGKLEVYTPI